MSLIENTIQAIQLHLLPESLVLYGWFALLTVALVAVDIYQTRGGLISLRKPSAGVYSGTTRCYVCGVDFFILG